MLKFLIQKKVYKAEYVKAQAGDDEFILGKAYPQGSGSAFVPCDPSAAIEHAGTFKNHLQTAGNAAMNVVNQMYYDVQIFGNYLDMGVDAVTFNQQGIINEKSEISSLIEEKEKTNKFYRDRATYKAAYDADNSIINVAMAVDGIGGMASIPEKISSIGTGLNNGIKIMNGTKLALEGTKVLEISVAGIGAVAKSGARALEAGLGIYNMSENDSSNGSENNEREGKDDAIDGDSNSKKRKKGTLIDTEIDTKYNDWSNNLKDNLYTGGRSNEEIQSLGKDPAHAGTKRIVDIEKAMHEGEVGLDLEGRGKLNDIVRDSTGKSEFIENGGNGQKWDVKSFNSDFKPNQGGFTLENSMRAIKKSLNEGEYAIVDTANLSQEHKWLLIEELKKQGLMDKIIIWP